MGFAYIVVDAKEGKAFLVFEEIKMPGELRNVIQRGPIPHEIAAKPIQWGNKPAIELVPTCHPKGLCDVLYEELKDFAKRAGDTLRNPAEGYRRLKEAFP